MLPKKVLFCTDFSENSEEAQRHALEYANALEAELIVLHVLDLWAGVPTYNEGLYGYVRDAVGRLEEAARSKLEELGKICGASVKKVTTLCVMGTHAEEIVRVANDQGVGLIVMGTHGWTGLRHMLLGSVAEKVLRTARSPVMVVRSR